MRAINSRCSDGDPKRCWSAFARRRYRWAGCSQVHPIPPCICRLSAANRKKASLAYTLARDTSGFARSSLPARASAAPITAARDASSSTFMSAQRCLMAWNDPMDLPNWTRLLAYSTALSSTLPAPPRASAATASAPKAKCLFEGGGCPTTGTNEPGWTLVETNIGLAAGLVERLERRHLDRGPFSAVDGKERQTAVRGRRDQQDIGILARDDVARRPTQFP